MWETERKEEIKITSPDSSINPTDGVFRGVTPRLCGGTFS